VLFSSLGAPPLDINLSGEIFVPVFATGVFFCFFFFFFFVISLKEQHSSNSGQKTLSNTTFLKTTGLVGGSE
jgi:hypothetical protein